MYIWKWKLSLDNKLLGKKLNLVKFKRRATQYKYMTHFGVPAPPTPYTSSHLTGLLRLNLSSPQQWKRGDMRWRDCVCHIGLQLRRDSKLLFELAAPSRSTSCAATQILLCRYSDTCSKHENWEDVWEASYHFHMDWEAPEPLFIPLLYMWRSCTVVTVYSKFFA